MALTDSSTASADCAVPPTGGTRGSTFRPVHTDGRPGASILLPLGLILTVLVAWRLGMGPVLSFWLAYILTRPLGANIGDYLASPRSDGGLGLGTFGTSVLFLGTILVVVVYLSITHADRTEDRAARDLAPDTRR